jgi:hypothetical protein
MIDLKWRFNDIVYIECAFLILKQNNKLRTIYIKSDVNSIFNSKVPRTNLQLIYKYRNEDGNTLYYMLPFLATVSM